jgi:hypothetical protein
MREVTAFSEVRRRRATVRLIRTYRPRPLPWSGQIPTIFEDLIRWGVGPAHRAADLFHIAYALRFSMEALVSWDLDHLASARVRLRIRDFCRDQGYNLVRIGTPVEVAEWLDVGLL